MPMPRRSFIAGSLAVPMIIPSSVLGQNSPSKRISLAHIGTGGRGSALMGGFLGLPDCHVTAVCDCFKSRRESAAQQVEQTYGAKGCKQYSDFRDLCADPAIDAVVVATPDHWHVLAALEAIRHGKHVYVEKPLGISVELDHALRKEVQRCGVTFQYGTQQRSQDHMRWACEMVLNGRIGKLKAVEVDSPGGIQGGSTTPMPAPADVDYDLYLGPAPEAPYTIDRCTSNGSYHISDFALGFIAGWGAHPLDIMVWGLGDAPESVPVLFEGTGVFPTSGLFDTAMAWDVQGSFADGKRFRFRGPGEDMTTFIGETGTIAVSRSGIKVVKPESLMAQKIGPGDKRLRFGPNYGQTYIDSIRQGLPGATPIEAAVYSDTTSHLSDIALRTSRTIHWDPVAEKIVNDPYASRMLHRPLRAPWRV